MLSRAATKNPSVNRVQGGNVEPWVTFCKKLLIEQFSLPYQAGRTVPLLLPDSTIVLYGSLYVLFSDLGENFTGHKGGFPIRPGFFGRSVRCQLTRRKTFPPEQILETSLQGPEQLNLLNRGRRNI